MSAAVMLYVGKGKVSHHNPVGSLLPFSAGWNPNFCASDNIYSTNACSTLSPKHANKNMQTKLNDCNKKVCSLSEQNSGL